MLPSIWFAFVVRRATLCLDQRTALEDSDLLSQRRRYWTHINYRPTGARWLAARRRFDAADALRRTLPDPAGRRAGGCVRGARMARAHHQRRALAAAPFREAAADGASGPFRFRVAVSRGAFEPPPAPRPRPPAATLGPREEPFPLLSGVRSVPAAAGTGGASRVADPRLWWLRPAGAVALKKKNKHAPRAGLGRWPGGRSGAGVNRPAVVRGFGQDGAFLRRAG